MCFTDHSRARTIHILYIRSLTFISRNVGGKVWSQWSRLEGGNMGHGEGCLAKTHLRWALVERMGGIL